MTVKTAKDTGLPMNIDPTTVARYGMGGALAGGAVASALNLVQMLREMSKKREERKAPTETDAGTIVLTLPSKTARAQGTEAFKGGYINDGNVGDYNASDPPASEGFVDPEKGVTNDSSSPTKVKKTEGPSETMTSSARRRQVRYVNGAYGIKTANWPTLTTSLLATGAGGYLGYRLVDKVFEVKRLKEKQKELDSARQEYLDMLAAPKTAGDDLFSTSFDKEARGNDTFGVLDLPMGIAALAFLLGGGGSAYITKRILDKMDDDQKGLSDVPKPAVKRIVFRSAPEAQADADTDEMTDGDLGVEQLKEAQAADEVFDAALGVYLDVLSGSPAVLGNEKVAAELGRLGMEPETLLPKQASDFDSLMATLEANPKLRQLMQGAMLESRPIARHFKWAFKLPGLQGMADRSLYSKIQQVFRPEGTKTAEEQKFGELVKEAGLFGPSLTDIAASFYGSTLAEKVNNEETPQVADPAEAEDPEERARGILKDLQISADDPAAARFVLKNKKKIVMILEQLANEGKI